MTISDVIRLLAPSMGATLPRELDSEARLETAKGKNRTNESMGLVDSTDSIDSIDYYSVPVGRKYVSRFFALTAAAILAFGVHLALSSVGSVPRNLARSVTMPENEQLAPAKASEELQSNGPSLSSRPTGRAVASRLPAPSRRVLPAASKTRKQAEHIPTIRVASDDVWGVRAYRQRYIGDALAYEASDSRDFRRLFDD